MRTRETLPVRLTPPCVRGLVTRESLFVRLDGARRARVVWVSAPGGAGKTTLVATYLAARGRPTLWLRLDAADAHIGTFAHLLRDAARACAGEAPPAPPELVASTRADAGLRRWIEALLASLPHDFAIVLDEYQSISAGAPVHALLPMLAESLPDGATVFVMSRDAPPATLARIAATRMFERLDAAALQLPDDEAAAIAASLGVVDSGAQLRLAKASGGWAAGIVLLARAMMAGVPLSAEAKGLPRELLDYFSAEVFDGLAPDVRRFLLRTAAAPWITREVAAALTGHPGAEQVLDALHRANLFIERKCGEPAVYEYHPLFRRFLAGRAREELAPSDLREVQRQAAAKLAEAGEPEQAVPLLAELHAWEEMAALVREHAPGLSNLGRVSTLGSWLDAMPEGEAAQRPWIRYWRAWCRHASREPGAAADFERARAGFAAAGDIEGEFAACAWLLKLADSRATAERWIREIECLAGRAQPLDATCEARIIAAFEAAPLFPPRHALIERWRERARSLARSAESARTRLQMAAFALARDLELGEIGALSALVIECRDAVDANGVAPADALAFLLLEGHYLLHVGADVAAAAILPRLEALADATGGPRARGDVARFAFRLALACGDAAAARRSRDACASAAGVLPEDAFARLLGDAELALLEGDAHAAVAAATAAGHYAALAPMWEPSRVACLAAALLESGESVCDVLHEIAPALDHARRDRMPAAELALLLVATLAHSRRGDADDALKTLAEALRLGMRMGSLPRMPNLPRPMLAELAALALRHDVQPRYAERLVITLGLAAPADAPPRWPWPIRVRTLGGFAVESRLARHAQAGRNARKPYELLKFVVAAGAREVAAGRAIATLWPDLDGDAGKKTFDITLHRLRKALGSDAAVRLECGKLSLDAQLVWVDAAAFERLATDAEALIARGDPRADRAVDEALSLYRGHFLAADDDLPWLAPHRARLADRFVRLVDVAGAFWEAAGDWQRAERHYRNAIALEPGAEKLHQRLIRTLAEHGCPAEALAAYRRCRELLSLLLATRPSARTEALCAGLRAGSPGPELVCEK